MSPFTLLKRGAASVSLGTLLVMGGCTAPSQEANEASPRSLNNEKNSIPAPDFAHKAYHKPINAFDQWEKDWYECTRYASGRTGEKTGCMLTFSRNVNRHGGEWYDILLGFSKGSEPKALSLASWKKGTYGHVAFVEKVEKKADGTVYITYSEANRNLKGKYNGMTTLDFETFKSRYGRFNGFVYLHNCNTAPSPSKKWPCDCSQKESFCSMKTKKCEALSVSCTNHKDCEAVDPRLRCKKSACVMGNCFYNETCERLYGAGFVCNNDGNCELSSQHG